MITIRIRFKHLPSAPQQTSVVVAIIIFSVMLHGGLFYLLSLNEKVDLSHEDIENISKVRVKFSPSNQTPKQISELKLKETAPPEKADLYGYQNRQAENQTVPDRTWASRPNSSPEKSGGPTKKEAETAERDNDSKLSSQSPSGKKLAGDADKIFAGSYENLLGASEKQVAESYKGLDFDTANFTLGQGLDANMLAHPLMSYFSKIRQAVELAYTAPSVRRIKSYMERKGLTMLQGISVSKVVVERDGQISSVEILDSSGHRIIDSHWEQILKDSGPYPPLPPTWEKNQLSFSYKLAYGIK